MYNLLLTSFMLMPNVFVRTLPVALLTALIYFGLIQNTDSPLWKFVFICLLTTPCIAIVRMAALRAALVATQRTTPPTIDHLTRAQVRLAYANLLPINVAQAMALTITTALISSDFSAALTDLVTGFATTGDLTGLDEILDQFAVFAQAAGWVFSIIAALGFGAMGTAMAATAANAAEKRPRHDITYGVGFQFWRLTALYYVAQAFNAIVVVLLAILVLAAFQVGQIDLGAYVLPVALTVYVALHFAFTAAGAALSYGALLDRDAAIRAYIQANIAGPETSTEDLRALRRARQHNG